MSDSNVNEVAKWLEDTINSFGFDSDGPGGETIGAACARAIAEDIQSSAVEVQAEPDGRDFPDNDDKYAAFKAQKYGRTGRAFGVRTGQLFSTESLMGSVKVSGDEMEMGYGTGKPVSTGAGGSGYVSSSDRDQTDIEKAVIITSLAKKRIDFYKLGPYAEVEVFEIVAEGLERHIKSRDV